MMIMNGIVWPSQGYRLYRNAQWCEWSCRPETSMIEDIGTRSRFCATAELSDRAATNSRE